MRKLHGQPAAMICCCESCGDRILTGYPADVE